MTMVTPMIRARAQAAAGCAALAAIFAGTAAADILVVSSSTPALKAGMQLPDTAEVDVPAGARLRVMLPSGATLTLNGPTKRTVKDISKGEPMVESVWAKAKELMATGGVDQSRQGATRSLTVRPKVEEPPSGGVSWGLIGAQASGNVCIERGGKLQVARPTAGQVAELTIIDTSANARATVAFADGAQRADWPASLKPNPDATYQIAAPGQPVRQLRLKPVDKAATSEAQAMATLLANDCRQQARAFLAQ